MPAFSRAFPFARYSRFAKREKHPRYRRCRVKEQGGAVSLHRLEQTVKERDEGFCQGVVGAKPPVDRAGAVGDVGGELAIRDQRMVKTDAAVAVGSARNAAHGVHLKGVDEKHIALFGAVEVLRNFHFGGTVQDIQHFDLAVNVRISGNISRAGADGDRRAAVATAKGTVVFHAHPPF